MEDQHLHEPWHENWETIERRKSKGRIWIGFLLLVAGGLLFLRSVDLLVLPSWLFSWPVFLIAIGFVSGVSERFRGGFWIASIFIGGLFLANEITPTLHVDRFIAPIVIFSIGLLFVFSPRKNRWKHRDRFERRFGNAAAYARQPSTTPDTAGDAAIGDRRDFVDVTAVFGAVKKNVLTKSFKGGDVTCFMGGAELNLSQADFSGEVRMDLTNVFGGTKLIVPPNWTIHSDIVTIFGGVDDKRILTGSQQEAGKTLVLDGTCLFGGIEIRSF